MAVCPPPIACVSCFSDTIQCVWLQVVAGPFGDYSADRLTVGKMIKFIVLISVASVKQGLRRCGYFVVKKPLHFVVDTVESTVQQKRFFTCLWLFFVVKIYSTTLYMLQELHSLFISGITLSYIPRSILHV